MTGNEWDSYIFPLNNFFFFGGHLECNLANQAMPNILVYGTSCSTGLPP